MAERIQLRRDTAANWESENPVLAQGEPGYDLDNDILKIGDGETPWVDLDDIQAPALAAHANDTYNPHQVTAAQVGADPAGTASAAVTSHEEAADPHPQYTTEAEASAAAPVQSVDGKTGTVDLTGSYEAKRQNNLSATSDPTVNDDSSAGYEPLSRWVNTSTGEIWLCVDATTGAANWQTATLTLDELGSAAVVDVGTGANQLPTVGDADGRYAQLTGGADANFAAMPQVNGDPIVESDSNANGEFTRWADGTQEVRAHGLDLTGFSGFAQVFTFPFPQPFAQATHAVPALSRDLSDWENGSDRYSAVSSGLSAIEAEFLVAPVDRDNGFLGTYGVIHYSATGHWK